MESHVRVQWALHHGLGPPSQAAAVEPHQHLLLIVGAFVELHVVTVERRTAPPCCATWPKSGSFGSYGNPHTRQKCFSMADNFHYVKRKVFFVSQKYIIV